MAATRERLVTRYRWAAAGLFALTVYGSLIPFQFSPLPLGEAVEAIRRAAFFDPADLAARGDWVISFVQYAAVSYLAAVAWGGYRTAAAVSAASCVGLAFALECAQVCFPPRTVSGNDLVVESLGAVAGTAVCLVAGRRITAWLLRVGGANRLADLARRLLPAYAAALFVVGLMPFDVVVSRAELAAKFAEGKVRLAPLGSPGSVTVHLILTAGAFAPLGLLVSLARRSGPAPAAAAALAAPVLLTALQTLVYSRTAIAVDVPVGMAGVWVGRRIGRRMRAKTTLGPGLPPLGAPGPALWAAWAAAVLYIYWRPFDFTTNPAHFTGDPEDLPVVGLRHMALAPFVDYYWGSKYHALHQFVWRLLSFLPGGMIAALVGRDVYRPSPIWLLGAAVAVVVEAGRYFLPSHMPSVTNALLGCTGVWLGFWFTRYVRGLLWADAALYGWLRPPPAQLYFITAPPDLTGVRRPRQG